MFAPYVPRSGVCWRRKGAKSDRGPDGNARRGEGGCMLWPFDEGAFAEGDDGDCVVWMGAPVSPPPPIKDEMAMLVPGRIAWPRPGSSLAAAKLGGYCERGG